MINRLFKWLFSFDRPVIRCKRCNRPLRSGFSRMTGYSDACWRKTMADRKDIQQSTNNIKEIAKDFQPK